MVFNIENETFSLRPKDVKILISIFQAKSLVLKNTKASMLLHGEWKNISNRSYDVLESANCIKTDGVNGNGTFYLTQIGHSVIVERVKKEIKAKFGLTMGPITFR